MLRGIFNHDSPVWRFIGKLGDLIMLNILWIIYSIPVFTADASTTAVYYMTLRLVQDEDDSAIWPFLRSFKSSFKQVTAIWFILLAAGTVLGFDFWFFVSGQMSINGTAKTAMTAASDGLLLIYPFIIMYVFPLQARFYNSVRQTLFNAFSMSMRHLFQTIGILTTDLEIVAATYFGLFYFPQFIVFLFLFGMPLIAFMNSYFFTAIFGKYMPKEEQNHTDATPLLDEGDEEMKEAIRNLKEK